MPSKPFIKVVRSNSYQRHHVTGLVGSLTPDLKKVSLELFEDCPPSPELMVLKKTSTDAESEYSLQESVMPEHSVERFVHLGITVPVEQLPSFIAWLQQKYNESQTIEPKAH